MIFAFLVAAASVAAGEISVTELTSLRADVLFLGETHDNPVHHENQAAAVAALRPRAVVWEMLDPEQAGRVTADLVKDQAALGVALEWENSNWPDFSFYYPIFAASGAARHYGAMVPRDAVRAAILGGDIAAAFGPGAERYQLTAPLPDDQQQQREAEQLEAHCNALPPEMLPGMVLGQRLRDARLAEQVELALTETGGPVAVITGNGHARKDWGAPYLLGDGPTVVTVGQLEASPDQTPPFDHFLVTAAAERDDPCKAFQ
nr:ChaN family lipoprotein [Shimia biformata]